MGEMRNAYTVLVGNPFGRRRCSLGGCMILNRVGGCGLDASGSR
jgi:hypothetical protein